MNVEMNQEWRRGEIFAPASARGTYRGDFHLWQLSGVSSKMSWSSALAIRAREIPANSNC